ncbi:MAG: hypothetical protein A2527_05800 [Candidatus Lambdaproteobacteria bacterium RIFOXYD2_FULL_50_16]|uniref:Histidinol-phosphatase n=1 Tax=Candidatus Lambdaproteobacteria bacterium RIFOXYD2_FULL_50_16 TaxID=1817772 RepID=A0A1F6G9D1_9PROT|nr:MAG: hypothetical protein A2527_05800 [Candidatus Lambdaproteobacteria bacterium RIFOXYD2_FULL_50_16]
MNLKWDGHCHTQFCPHGKQEPTESMIRRAIDLGFERLSLTEHAPLPKGLMKDQKLFDELALKPEELEPYLDHAQTLKAKFAGQIEIWVGLELDYLPGYETFTVDFFEKWGPKLDDSLLSMHFIPGQDGLCMVDYNPQDFQENLLDHYGSLSAVHLAYWNWFEKGLALPFKGSKPKRLGHPGLINKFCLEWGEPEPEVSPGFFEPIVAKAKAAGYQLDHNHSGLGRASCLRTYMPMPLLQAAQKAGMELIYGSDAHGVQAIGGFFDSYLAGP